MEVISTTAPEWKQFGLHFSFDDSGRVLDRIAREHQLRPIDCCTQMMGEWLEGRGRQPATWAILIQLLKDAQFDVLAQQLEKMMLKGHTQPAPGS